MNRADRVHDIGVHVRNEWTKLAIGSLSEVAYRTPVVGQVLAEWNELLAYWASLRIYNRFGRK